MALNNELGPIEIMRRQGHEEFHNKGRGLPFSLIEFWQWSCSDLVSNATRGILAEYIVAQAIGVADGVREEWAAYDLTSPDGTRIEVKSAAYIQSWHQERLSTISFDIRETRAWDKAANRHSYEVRRQADVYVFALLAHTDQNTLDPMAVSQWEFFVVPTEYLDIRVPSQRSITLTSLQKLAGNPFTYAGLQIAIEKAARMQKKLTEAKVQV